MFTHCCAVHYIDKVSDKPMCELKGLPGNYPGGCTGFYYEFIGKINEFTERAKQAQLKVNCDSGNYQPYCNTPEW